MLTTEQCAEAVALMKAECPDMYEFIMELYRQDMIDGLRNITYVKIGDKEIGTNDH